MCALVIERSLWIVHEILLEAPTVAMVDVSFILKETMRQGKNALLKTAP